MAKCDFSGWATVVGLRCADGRTILKDAFAHNDRQKVPLVWNHGHNEVKNVLGHAILSNRDRGVYADCFFNETSSAQDAKEAVLHGDIVALSIYANQLKQDSMGNVSHGNIREVSLVLAGANPGALIDNVLRHGEESEDEAYIYNDEIIELQHSEEEGEDQTEEPEEEGDQTEESEENLQHADGKSDKSADKKDDPTVGEVWDTLTDIQKEAVYIMTAEILAAEGEKENPDDKTDKKEESEGGTKEMKQNVFDKDKKQDDVLKHSDVDMATIISDAKRYGSLKDSVLAHGIEQIDYLYPYGVDAETGLTTDGKNVTNTPIFIKRDTGWVGEVMNAVHRTPFSRIKSMFANITEEDARAKGYIKGKLKKDEVFTLLKRVTGPTTVYKKQKLDRDDVVDITDFDVVAWIKSEMRGMLDEELARAFLVGDNRKSSSDDKINELCIRPVWKDEDLFTIKKTISLADSATADDKARAFIRTVVKARKEYKGSGNPVCYTTEDVLTDCLLMEDKNGRVIYESVDKLARALRVSKIVTVPVMEGLTRTDAETSKTLELLALVVNLSDYNVGADKGGAVNMFDDFDIDYNALKYLIETRCSGALTVPYSAIAVELETEEVAG